MSCHPSTRGRGWACIAVTLVKVVVVVVVSKNNNKKNVNFNSFRFRPRRGAACVAVTSYLATPPLPPTPLHRHCRSVNHSRERDPSANSNIPTRNVQSVFSADCESTGPSNSRVTTSTEDPSGPREIFQEKFFPSFFS